MKEKIIGGILSFFIALTGGLLTDVNAGNKKLDTGTVNSVNIQRYLGKWYEIARFPHKFEDGLEKVTAEYSIRDDGKIRVLNSGFNEEGRLKTAEGKAYIPDPKDQSRLKVSFFWFFYGDYYILELDQKNYSWAMVGSSSEDFLWILSRTPKLDKEILEYLMENAAARGYDLSKLVLVEH